MEIKPQLKPRGSVAKEEDRKPSLQLYKLQIKSKQSTRQTLCLWNIYKVIESSHKKKKKNALVLIAVDSGSKNLEEQDQIRI